jgi:prevent-host-death family protein
MNRINYEEDIQSLSEFRSGVSSYIQKVTETKRPMIITQRGRGVAILTDIGEFEAMQSKLEFLEDLYKAESQISKGEGVPHKKAKKQVLDSLR